MVMQDQAPPPQKKTSNKVYADYGMHTAFKKHLKTSFTALQIILKKIRPVAKGEV